MRYEKGTMELSPARDIPLLQQVLRSGFVTGDQLYEFMRLEQTEGSRQAFDHRVRRLVGHGLIEKRPGLARGRHQVYSISKDGASVLIDAGELFAGRRNVDVVKQSCAHWLELNEVHLALWRSRALVRWTPATEICSQNLTSYRYAKDYDAVVAVGCDGGEARFALEYERTPKTQVCGHLGPRAFQTAGIELRDNWSKSFATPRRARGSTGQSAPYTEELTRPWKGGVVCLPFPRRNCAKSRSSLTARAWGIPVRAVGRASFGAVNMSTCCKEACRTRRTIEWSSLLQSKGCAPLSGPAKSQS
jgi:hypothetical protein